MTRLLLITFLILLCSGPACAEWMRLTSSEDTGDTTLYGDPETNRRKGDLVKAWFLIDEKTKRTVAGQSHLSSKHLYEFDCAEERMRLLAVSNFSDNMGRGKVVFSNSDEQKWEPVQPGSVGQGLWGLACGK
jgi:hypothetical protein